MVFHPREGFFKKTTRQFGYHNTRLLKMWIITNIKLVTLLQQLKFLLKCRRYDILPPHIMNLRFNVEFRSKYVNHKFCNVMKRYRQTVMNLEISDINSGLRFLRDKLREIEECLSLNLPESLLSDFFIFNNKRIHRHNTKVRTNLIDKFNRILCKCNPVYASFCNNDRKKWIVDVSRKSIPDHVLNVLSLGEKFGLPIFNSKDRLNAALNVIKNFEQKSYTLPPGVVNEIRSSIANALHNFLTKDRHIDYISMFLTNEYNKCKKFLNNNKDILVTKADKGQVTVVMDRDVYVNQMEELLRDQTTYRKLKKDPINSITNKLNDLIKSWLNLEIIEDSIYKRLRCTNGNLPRCYGLPKVHKKNFPLRIIVSTLGSPLYNVASFLHEILHKSIPKPSSYVKDSWSFVKKIKGLKISQSELLVSLDVTALFTNIPKELVLQAIEKRWCYISQLTAFSLTQFLYAVELILSSTSFKFNGQVYEQIFGSPMGSPLSPILADLVMEDLEVSCLGNLKSKITVFLRYVDDIFAIIPRAMIDDVLNIFNNYHPRLQFTCEIENNNTINFLDTTVIRNSGTLITNWYRKPTFSGRYINYLSNHPDNYKKNVVTGLVDRAILLSDRKFHSENIEIVKEILCNNCYPDYFIKKHVNQRLKEIRYRIDANDDNDANDDTDNVRKNFISIPYMGNQSNICTILRKCGFEVAYTVPKKLNNIIQKGKDGLDCMKQTEVVYKIDCNDCNATYIGQTKRHLETRIREHKSDIKKHASNYSVISKHRLDFNHDFDWTRTKILHREKNVRKREIAEMFFIKKHTQAINLQKDTENLSTIYDKIVNLR